MDKEKRVIKKQEVIILLIIIMFLCFWGGIYDFSVTVYGVVLGMMFFWLLIKEKKIFIPKGVVTICLAIIFVGYLGSVFIAVDKGMAVIGVIRQIPIIIFWIIWNNINTITKERIKDHIVSVAAFLTLGSMIAYFSPVLRKQLFRAGRLGGVFQYSNTYAAFLLICCIHILYRNKKKKQDYMLLGILFTGIVICESRSVFVLTIIAVIIYAVKSKKDKKYFILMVVFVAGSCIALQLIFKLDLLRLLKISTTSSTLNGRFLYWRDAVYIMGKHPFGLGYMGYYFLQPVFQTGNYTVKFVHNDVLQYGLDAGIIPMAAFVVMIIVNILSKKNKQENRGILAIMFLHLVFDFDMQYMSMFFWLLMCMNDQKAYMFSGRKNILKIFTGLVIILNGYFAVAFGFGYFQMYENSLKMYPGNTLIRIEYMLQREDKTQADFILKTNKMVTQAYEYKIQTELEEKNYKAAVENVESLLKYAGYQIELYNQAVYYYSIALEQAVKNNDEYTGNLILEDIREVPKQLQQLKKRTTILAYRINDKPEFELRQEIQNYINKMDDIVLQ